MRGGDVVGQNVVGRPPGTRLKNELSWLKEKKGGGVYWKSEEAKKDSPTGIRPRTRRKIVFVERMREGRASRVAFSKRKKNGLRKGKSRGRKNG